MSEVCLKTVNRHDPNNPRSLSSDLGWSVFEDSKGHLWFGTEKGLNHLDRTTGQFIHYQHDPADPNSLSHNIVTMMIEDKQGFLWTGTYGGGLNRYDSHSNTFSRHQHQPNKPHSLSHDEINAVWLDSDNTLWIGTQNGLNCLDLSSSIKPSSDVHFSHYFH